ncbi:hypothetical protein HDU79_005281 [Rhizoclosmatium sp. JEL0117]|nr:hypothetical protein HDU79_005281 [Rhizoclosmatium sp. JEL0117]
MNTSIRSLQKVVRRVILDQPGIDCDEEVTNYIAELIYELPSIKTVSDDTNIDTVAKQIAESVATEMMDLGVANTASSCNELLESILETYICELKSPIQTSSSKETEHEFEEDDDDAEDDAEDLLPGCCEICYCNRRLGFHHLIPRMTHKRVVNRGLFTIEDCRTRGIMVCGTCHRTLHRRWTHMELALKYNTLDKIMADEGMVRYQAWAERQKKRKKAL